MDATGNGSSTRRGRRTGWRALATGTGVALGLLLPFASQAECKFKAAEMPVHMVGTRVMTSVGINGQDVPLMVDTGAFYSFLTDAAAAQLHLPTRRAPGLNVQGLTGRVTAHLTTVEHLKMLKGSISDVDFVVGGNELGGGAMGLLGRNLLTFTDTEYDLAHGVIRFVFPNEDCAHSNMAYWTDGPVGQIDLLYDVGVEMKRQAIRGTAKLNGVEVDVLFDTGATTTVSLAAARKAGVKPQDMTPEDEMYGAGRNTAQSWTAPFATFELGGEAVNRNRLEVGDFDIDDGEMLLGVDFFLSHRIYVSNQQKRMFFTYNGGPVFALNKAPHASAASAAPAGQADDPLDADAHARRGAASLARHDLAGALADLDRACALAPQTAAYFTARAAVHAELDQAALAQADLDTALRLDPGQADARLQRAAMRQETGNADGALEDLAALDRTLAPQADARRTMARLYATLRMPARVVPQWDQWIQAHPHDIHLPSAYNERCWARVLLGTELPKALADCDDAIDRDDRDPAYPDSRGWVRLRMGQWAKALSDFDRALARSPDIPTSLYGRGIAHARLGDATASAADFAAARKASPTIAADLQTMGLSQAQLAPQAGGAAAQR